MYIKCTPVTGVYKNAHVYIACLYVYYACEIKIIHKSIKMYGKSYLNL